MSAYDLSHKQETYMKLYTLFKPETHASLTETLQFQQNEIFSLILMLMIVTYL